MIVHLQLFVQTQTTNLEQQVANMGQHFCTSSFFSYYRGTESCRTENVKCSDEEAQKGNTSNRAEGAGNMLRKPSHSFHTML